MMVGMDVRLLYVEDCPNWRLAESRLRQALAAMGDGAPAVIYELVSTPGQAQRSGFRGSPSILINGHDPFAGPEDPVGLSCRIYRNPAGVEHAPTVEALRSVLASAR